MRSSIKATAALCVAVLSTVAGCGTGHRSGSAATTTTLRVGMNAAVQTLDPAKSGQPPVLVFIYDPLIYKTSDGRYQPDLATSWKYTDSTRRSFQFALRSGVTFADGSALTADAVKKSFEYFLATPNPNLSEVGAIDTVQVVDEHTVQINYKSAFPDAVQSLSQYYGMGMVIGPKGLANPASLATSADGVGQYTVDPSATVANSLYTYNANAKYWNPAAVRYKQVQVKVLPDNNARMAALRSGQIDLAVQVPLSQLGAATATGYTVIKSPSTWMVLFFANRLKGPLANPQVRQALNYAIDRDAVVKDFYQGFAESQDQFSPAGTVGYAPDLAATYSFDAAKAKSMLAAAGYPNGLTLHVLTASVTDPGGLLGQTVKSQLASIGVTVDLTVESGNFSQFGADLSGGKFDTILWNLFSADIYAAVNGNFVGTGLLNSYKISDSTVDGLLQQAASASDDQYGAASAKVNAYLTQNAWGVPIATRYNTDVAITAIKGVNTNPVTPTVDPVGPDAGLSWAP